MNSLIRLVYVALKIIMAKSLKQQEFSSAVV